MSNVLPVLACRQLLQRVGLQRQMCGDSEAPQLLEVVFAARATLTEASGFRCCTNSRIACANLLWWIQRNSKIDK